MLTDITRRSLIALVLIPSVAAAQPVKLKLAFSTSDRSELYLNAIKPLVDAVNAEASGVIEIEVYFSGALGGVPDRPALQPQSVLDNVADIALIISGQSQSWFPDDAVLGLPGLFHDAREATLSYTWLIHQEALRGYERFFVIGAFATGPGFIHGRHRLTSLSDLKGMKISATTPIEAKVLERLGAVSTVMPLPLVMDAISGGRLDGAAVSPTLFGVFGIGRLTNHHYLLPISGGAHLALVMSRKTFQGLPEQARDVLQKYGPQWMAARFVNRWQMLERDELERMKSNPRRVITVPSPADSEAAQAAFRYVKEEWAAKDSRNSELLVTVEKGLNKIRSMPQIPDVPIAFQDSPY